MSGSKHDAATVAAIGGEAMERIEIVGERRRAHDAEFRARVLAEAAMPGARVQAVASRYGICLNRTYQEMAAHYGAAVLPTGVRRPRDKAKVEVAVLIVQ